MIAMNPLVYLLYMCLLPSNLPLRTAFEKWQKTGERHWLDCDIESIAIPRALGAHIKYMYQEEEDWAMLSGNSLRNFLSKYAGSKGKMK
jgi:hypothetical protein